MKRFSARTVSWCSIALEGIFIILLYSLLYANLQTIERMVGESREAYLPSIQEGQRTLLNLEYLRHSISLLSQAPDEESLRSVYTNIRALLAEIVFDKRVDGTTLRDLAVPVRTLYESRSRALTLHADMAASLHGFFAACAQAGHTTDAEDMSALWLEGINLTENSASVLMGRVDAVMSALPPERAGALLIYAQRVRTTMEALLQARAAARQLADDILARLTSFRVAASDSEVELIYSELNSVSVHAERIRQVVLHLCIGLTCCLVIFGWLLHRHVFQPIMQASHVLADILNGRAVTQYPSSKIRELDAMIRVLPLLQQNMLAKDARSSLLEKEYEQLKSMSFQDSLTGLFNRRALDMLLKGGLPDQHAAIMMFDIDFFKQYNDTLGHLAGDEALRRVGEIAQCHAGNLCTPFRYGGEEFVVIFQGEDAEPGRVRATARNMMTMLEAARIPHPSSPWGCLTVSIGIAFRTPGTSSLHETLDMADKALYRAKSRGRRRVEEAEIPDTAQEA